MKKAWILISVVAFLATIISCQVVEPTPQFPKSDAPFSVTSSVTSVGVAAKDSLANVISFTWTDPNYSVGLTKSKFSVIVGATGKGFVSFSTKDFSGVLNGVLLGKEVNAMALKFGGVIGQPITLDVKIVASHGSNNEQINSNVLQVAVTPYGDLTITPSTTTVVTDAATSSNVGVSLTWNAAFNGYSGVKMYQLQYAKGGTSFATLTSIDVTTLSKSFTQFELNKIALALGVPAGAAGPVEFRIKATNESGTVLYSNVASVSVKTYIAFNSIGIIGDATPGGWNVDTDMHRPDATKPTEWTATLYLTGGMSVKFRADDGWTDNWGSGAFPTGTGTSGGANIPVSNSGYYQVNFNIATGAYSFTSVTTSVYNFVSLIGAQTSWGSDIADLTIDPTNNQVWTGTVTLAAGQLKFRADHAWGTNWGTSTATSLSGYGVPGGGNMEIVTAGTYFVYINVATGEYFFGPESAVNATPYAALGIIGDATAGGWGADTQLIKNPANAYKWSKTITLVDGGAKFRADNAWTINWGSSGFPNGVGTQGGNNIPATAGTYVITFHTGTGEYTFTK